MNCGVPVCAYHLRCDPLTDGGIADCNNKISVWVFFIIHWSSYNGESVKTGISYGFTEKTEDAVATLQNRIYYGFGVSTRTDNNNIFQKHTPLLDIYYTTYGVKSIRHI